MFESLANKALELVYPTRCIGCDEPGELLCEACRKSLPWIDQRYACPNCGAPFGALTCTECDLPKGVPWETRSCISALPLEGIAHALILAYKDKGERRLAPVIAAILATALDEARGYKAPDGLARFDTEHLDALCFVPATAKAYQRRGFDHMEAVTKNLGLFLDIPVADILARPKGKDQRTLSRQDRLENTKDAIQVLGSVQDCAFLLVDDVITTGSSVRSCARALLGAGAQSVSVCSLARTW